MNFLGEDGRKHRLLGEYRPGGGWDRPFFGRIARPRSATAGLQVKTLPRAASLKADCRSWLSPLIPSRPPFRVTSAVVLGAHHPLLALSVCQTHSPSCIRRMSQNPYSTPDSPTFSLQQSVPPDLSNKLAGPAIGLIIVGCLNVLSALWNIVLSVLTMLDLNPMNAWNRANFGNGRSPWTKCRR